MGATVSLIIIGGFVVGGIMNVAAQAAIPMKQVLEDARALALKKERSAALRALSSAALHERKGSRNFKTLVSHLDIIGTQFYSEKAQKEFEIGDSLLTNQGKPGTPHFLSALELEKDNLTVLWALVRNYLMLKDCPNALRWSLKAYALHPFAQDSVFLRTRALFCNGPSPVGLEFLNLNHSELTGAMGLALRAEYLGVSAEDRRRVKGMLLEAIKEDPNFPESYFLLWQTTSSEDPSEAQSYGQNYLLKCDTLTHIIRRKYRLEPNLCGRTSEVKSKLSLEAEGAE